MKTIPWKDSLSSTKGAWVIRYTNEKKKKNEPQPKPLKQKINSKRKLQKLREHFQDLKLDKKSKQNVLDLIPNTQPIKEW